MAYYLYINSGNPTFNTLQQFQGFYSQIPSFYQTTEDYANSSLYTLSWTQTDFLKQNQTAFTLPNTISLETTQITQSLSPVFQQKPKKRAQKTLEKQILSAKKNSQSNIINQFYSFFGSRDKSEKILETCCLLMGKKPEQVQKIVSLFYLTIRLINSKRGRKYVNVAMFLKFFSPQQLTSYLPELVQKLEDSGVLNMDELCQIFRRCCKHFLKNISQCAILTSKRISIVSKEQHLKKRRKFLRTIMQL